jgi:lipopolysaccharide export system protein LptA
MWAKLLPVATKPLALVFLLALGTLTGRLSADPAPPGGEPLAMTADHLELDLEAKTAVLTGHVKLGKGGLSVACPRVDVRYDQVPHVTWAKGTGGVSAEVKGIKAEAPEVELDLQSQVLELRGGVRLSRGEGWISAERASIQIATGKVSMTDVKGAIPVKPGEPGGAPAPAPKPAP